MNTAILVDGGFYIKRAQTLWGCKSPSDRAQELFTYCLKHINGKNENRPFYSGLAVLHFQPHCPDQYQVSRETIKRDLRIHTKRAPWVDQIREDDQK